MEIVKQKQYGLCVHSTVRPCFVFFLVEVTVVLNRNYNTNTMKHREEEYFSDI